MTFLIIAMIFLGIIAFLLMSSLSVTFKITDKVIFKVSVLGICIYDINSNKNKKQNVEKKITTTKKGFSDILKDYAKNKNNKELIFELFSLIKELCVEFSAILKHIRIKKLEVNLKIASDDAAKTAILYGNACSLVYSVVALIKSSCDFDHKKIQVSADFSSESISFFMLSNFKIRIIHILTFALAVTRSIIKMKLGENKNGRTQH